MNGAGGPWDSPARERFEKGGAIAERYPYAPVPSFRMRSRLGRRAHPDPAPSYVPRWQREIEAPECPPGWQTGPPDFVGVGGQRCGTSWWYRGTLRSHPQMVRLAKPGKELHYFDRFWEGEPPADFAERYHRLFPRPEGSITGEWTPRYMLDFWALPLLKQAAPEAKILVMLRDPVERFRSGVEYERTQVAENGQIWELSRLSEAVYRSMYYEQLRHVLGTFDPGRVLILQYEHCKADPVGEMQRTHRFLGIEPLPELPEKAVERKRPPASKPELPEAQRAELIARLGDDVARLAALVPGIDLSLWPDFAGIVPDSTVAAATTA